MPLPKKTLPAYSLIELTIVVGLVAILAVAISSIVLVSITQSSRIRAQLRTRQTGDYAVTQLQTMLRNARTVVSCDSGDNEITIQNPDGRTTTFASELDGNTTHIASNSGIYLTPDDVTVASSFELDCAPNDTSPTLVTISFDLDKTEDTGRSLETPPIHFETSVELRNLL